mgnify:CR=1 FL=1
MPSVTPGGIVYVQTETSERAVKSINVFQSKSRLLKTARILAVVLVMFAHPAHVSSQASREIELTAQEILARVDRILEYPQGLMKGKLMHITPDGRSSVTTLAASIAERDFLFVLSSRDRGNEVKILYNLGGEDIWVYDIHAVKLFHKLGIDKYDAVLGTNYSFIDLSNADYQNNYNASITGNAFVKGFDTYRLKLDPIFKGGSYGQLTMYVGKTDYVPLRIDFHDTDNVRIKSLAVVKTKERAGRTVPVRYEMLDIMKGTVSIMELSEFDESVTFDRSMFFHQRLGDNG